jgi:hypothetical protein
MTKESLLATVQKHRPDINTGHTLGTPIPEKYSIQSRMRGKVVSAVKGGKYYLTKLWRLYWISTL